MTSLTYRFLKVNPNVSKRHDWTASGVCNHCGLRRKIVRWKELTEDRRIIYRHKTKYYWDNLEDALEVRPSCNGKYFVPVEEGRLTEEELTPQIES